MMQSAKHRDVWQYPVAAHRSSVDFDQLVFLNTFIEEGLCGFSSVRVMEYVLYKD